MFKIIVVLISYLITYVAQAQNMTDTSVQSGGGRVMARVQNIRNNVGSVYFTIYDSQENFNNRIAFDSKQAVVMDNRVEVVFENLPQKSYAIVCFHDANNNGKMDFEEGGMPLEDYGTSAPNRSFGPPSYRDAQFEVKDKELTFDIKF
jgi:uncharacterized protein (DUF2141 family)